MKLSWKEKDFPLAKEWLEFKIEHYKAVFGEFWREVFMLSKPRDNEELLIAEFDCETAGKCYCSRQKHGLKLRDYTVLPRFRGKGIGKTILEELESRAKQENLDYLVSFPYLIPLTEEEKKQERFEMSQFYAKAGFRLGLFDIEELDSEEGAALTAYLHLNWAYSKQLRVFRKRLVPIDLSDEVKTELKSLDASQKRIVLTGLAAKLGAYEQKGYLSYKYSVCPVCNDIGSTLESLKCDNCYISRTCKEPFNKGFRYDDVTGFAYFAKVRDFLLAK